MDKGNKDLLKEAIAEARAVKETALANAKIALEEAFAPRLQSMISAKLSEEEGEYEEEPEMEPEMEMEPEVEAPAPEPEMEPEMDMEPEMEPEMDVPPAEPEMDEEDLELEAIIRELEGSLEEGEYEEEEAPMEESSDSPEEMEEPAEEEMAEEGINIDEVIAALREEEEGEEEPMEEASETEINEIKSERDQLVKAVKFMKSKLNEVNLLNAKLLYSNKLFRNYKLSDNQKVKVIENFDRAASTREVKIVYSTLSEAFKVNEKRSNLKENKLGSASKPAGRSTAPKKEILSEGSELQSRWTKLVNYNR